MAREMVFIQGRVVAATLADAMELIAERLARQGYVAGEIRPRPCPVQPYIGKIWWEYQTRVSDHEK